MYKEWMNEKRTKKDFRLDEKRDQSLWVHLPSDNREEEVEPLNIVFDESEEFNEIAKKYILNGMRDYSQCFITIMAYNLMWTQNEELKILNLTDDRLGHLRIVHRDRIEEWIDDYLRWYRNAVTRISMITDACSGVSFWPVKVGTRSSRIARLAMQPCTTSGGSNPTSTRYSE